jgi:hypothetical protein
VASLKCSVLGVPFLLFGSKISWRCRLTSLLGLPSPTGGSMWVTQTGYRTTIPLASRAPRHPVRRSLP